MIEDYEANTGCHYQRMKLWEVASLRTNDSCCRPCLEIEWSGDTLTLKTFHPGDWERELLGYVSAQAQPFGEVLHEDDY